MMALRHFSLVMAAMLAMPASAVAECYDRDARGHQTRFRIVGGEAHDLRSGLIWQRCSVGTRWDGKNGCAGQIAYLGLDAAIAAAADGWRVPSGPELESIVDEDCGSPVVDPSVFPDIGPDEEGHAKYWTTNPVGTLDMYWNFDFVDGHPDGNTKGIQLMVRFVRTKN
jgi:hypothetical protein